MKGRRGAEGPAESPDSSLKPVEASSGLVAKVRQVRQRLFAPRIPAIKLDDKAAKSSEKPSAPAALNVPKRSINFQASIAEFFLVNRLRARSQQSKQSAEILERASHIVFVTCKHWFAEEDKKPGRHETRI